MSSLPAPGFLELQSALAGRFSLEREIGSGGMGIVFLARDVRLERPVAIKLLAPHLSARPDMRRRFLREARIAAQCFHPNIVPIHAVEEIGNLAFIVMSFVRGETLAQRIARSGPLPVELVQRIARDVGWALAYAHERGVVHRDIKPENILLEDGSDRSLISDFGIALHDDPTRTPATGEIAGTASYMAPEQAMGEKVDGRADLYALGATLFVAASGVHPFQGRSAAALIAQHALVPAPAAVSVAPLLPRALADAIDRCLAKNVDDRFPDAASFVRAIETTVPAQLSRALSPVRDSANATRTLLGSAGVVAVTTMLLGAGEDAGSFGRSILLSVGWTFTVIVAAAAALRAVETLVQTRRALRSGASQHETILALMGENAESDAPATSTRLRGAVMAVGGGLLAYLEGTLTAMTVEGWLSDFTLLACIVLPPLLIARGSSIALKGSRQSAWLRDHIARPISTSIMRMFGSRPETPRALPESGPTEIVLDRAAQDLFRELSVSMQRDLAALPGAIAALSRDAERLRAADKSLADAERAARAGHGASSDEVGSVLAQRELIQQRLATTIAALEAIRLDLMRAASGAVDTSGLTTHLEAVRHLQHRVDADAEVRTLLARET